MGKGIAAMAATTQKQADTYFFNLRFLLITFVFLGNAMEPMLDQYPTVKSMFLWIFTFHMPLFVMVTGYFARYSLTGDAGKRMLRQIALQYVIFQSLYSLMDVLIFHVPNIKHSFFVPYLLVWFLFSHLCWRLLLLLSIKLNIKHPILVAAALGVLVGYLGFNGSWLSISRTFVYLPFFFIGYRLNFDKVVKYFSIQSKALAVGTAVLLFGVLYFFAKDVQPSWLFGSLTFKQMGQTEWYAGILRIFIYALEGLASLAILALVPRREFCMTDWGKRTVYVFLIHGFVVRFMAISGLYDYMNSPFAIALMLAGVVGCTILLAQPQVMKITKPIIEPQTDWMVTIRQKAKALSR